MTEHRLKTLAPFFAAVLNGSKTFELRLNDRGFAVGDVLILEEYIENQLTGRAARVDVTFLLDRFPGLEDGYCVLGIGKATIIKLERES